MCKRLALLIVSFAIVANARLLRIEVSERSDVLGGMSFGASGPYERLTGKAFFGVDPSLPANQTVVDLRLAPRNAASLVEFSADLYILKPRDGSKGNGAVLFEVSNRGGKGTLSTFDRAAGSTDPRSEAQFGDKMLLQQGYTLVWLGWQFDVPRTPGLLRLDAPVATENGKPITGLVRSEFVPDSRTTVMPLADRNHIPYPVVAIRELTVRDNPTGVRKPVSKGEWSLRDAKEIYMERGFEPGKFYELVYTAKDPTVVGLGSVGIRDLISFLKYKSAGHKDVPAGLEGSLQYAYGFGVSQSGRFLRKFLYDGFNAGEDGKTVFDGMLVHVAGAGRGSFNHRFAQPSRDGHPYMNVLYPTDLFPFTDLPETDPATGRQDSILRRAMQTKTVPKIFYTNSSYEYWGRAASLIHTTPDGKEDAALPETTRIYFFAGGQHGPAAFPPHRNGTVNASNPNDYRWALRALLTAMDKWVRENAPPPDSVYPRISKAQLVTLAHFEFPKIPGQRVPLYPKMAPRLDFGPEYPTKGIVSQEPPTIGESFPVMVPQADADGTDLGGIRMPEVAVPLATYTGWNLRDESIGAQDQLYSMQGSWIPFPRIKTAGDARRPLGERYSSRAQYLNEVRKAAEQLVEKRLLLASDVAPLMKRSEVEWVSVATEH